MSIRSLPKNMTPEMSDGHYDQHGRYIPPATPSGCCVVKDARIVAFSVALNRLADATRDLEKDNSAKDARIAALEAALSQVDNQREVFFRQKQEAEAQLAEAKSALSAMEAQNEHMSGVLVEAEDLLGVEETGELILQPIERMLARITSLEKSVTDARDALMTNPITQPEVSFLRNARKAALAILDAAEATREVTKEVETVADAHARIASLEKSVTMLRAENVELREIAGGLSYYADGHGLQEKWAAELRDLNQRLGALAQATDQPAPCDDAEFGMKP